MKIAFIASEMVPFAKTGGLADVTSTLSAEIQQLGHEVVTVLPRYKQIEIRKQKLKVEIPKLEVPVGSEKIVTKIYGRTLENGQKIYFVDYPEYFGREAYYGTPKGDYPDNDKRFIFFQRATLELLKKIKFKSDVIHCHDWQAGLIPVYLKTLYSKDAFFNNTRSVFTIHNLAYQGNFPPDSLPATGLAWSQFTMERLEFYGKVSFMKGGVLDADVVTTVSEQYAQEIQSKEFGCGLEGVLESRGDTLHGIVNGIDPHEWDPETDPDLVKHFGFSNFEGKVDNKLALQEENDFKHDKKAPLIGIISRLVDQKGMDILIPAIPEMMEMGVQFTLLGTGEEKYHKLLRQLGKKHHEQCGIHIIFDSKMAKRIYAGCDMLLVPSYYEPCGLGQMIALRFGTIPIVRETGGLADTIFEFDPDAGKGNGFLFQDYTSEALMSTIKKAVQIFKDKSSWSLLMQNAMACDYSWKASAEKYIRLYQSTKKRTVKDKES